MYTISKSIFVLTRVKHILLHTALKTLHYTLIHNHLTYGIQAWGNASNINKLMILQKCAVRNINKSVYRDHTDPLFKFEEILKITDLHKLHVTLFMFDQQSGSPPTSFKTYFPNMTNNNNSSTLAIITRQHTGLRRQRPRTTFFLQNDPTIILPSY